MEESQSGMKSKRKISNNLLILICLAVFGLSLRVIYAPFEVPIATDGFFSFVYSAKTIFEGSLPIGYTSTNTGWAYVLSLVFTLSGTTEPLHMMNIQRLVSIIFSTIIIIPAFFIFKRFVSDKIALFGCLMLILEPRLLLNSFEGHGYALFIFLFVLSLSLFLKRTNLSLIFSFASISFASIIRYEAILLLIPFSIMFFKNYEKKNNILKFLGLILVVSMILVPISFMRIDATQEYCYDSFIGEVCGKDGIMSNFQERIEGTNNVIVLGNPDIDDPIYNSEDPMISHFIILSFSNLLKFLGIILIPYFFIFVGMFIVKIKRKENLKINREYFFIIFSSCIMLLPAIYAYGRGMEESRYVLVLIPLICIISISGIKSVPKIFNSKTIMIFLILIVISTSIAFVNVEKRDYIHDKESFLVSQEIIKLTSTTNMYDQDGYIKTASLIEYWPELPEHDKVGKIKNEFQKISLKEYETIEELIRQNEDLEFIVVDEMTDIFRELRNETKKYPYLEKKFDSKDLGYVNSFQIYKINYQKLGEM